jgi:pyrimidine operon attenuation protein/uracil phosphoribosyltransferase
MGILLSSGDIDRAIKRISHEIIENNQGVENLVLMGIPTRGALILQIVSAHLYLRLKDL